MNGEILNIRLNNPNIPPENQSAFCYIQLNGVNIPICNMSCI